MNNKSFISQIKFYCEKNKTIIIYSFILAIVCYGYELFNFSLSIDEELFSFVKATEMNVWVADGRWGIYFINILLMPFSVLPYYPTLISILCMALACIIFINGETTSLLQKIVFSTIFISHPVHSYYLTFNIYIIPIGIGIVLSTISFVLSKKILSPSNKINYLISFLSIISLTISFSTYQALIPIYLILTVSHLINKMISDKTITVKEIVKEIIVFAIVFIIAFSLYKIFDLIFKQLLVSSQTINSRKYLDNFQGWGKHTFKRVITNTITNISNYFIGKRFYGGGITLSALLLAPILFLNILIKVKERLLKFFGIILILILIISPFTIMIIAGNDLPPRAMLSISFMVASLWWLVLINSNYWIKRLIAIIALFVFLNNFYFTTKLFYTANTSWQTDLDVANRIVERIYYVKNPKENKSIPVVFIGKYNHPQNEFFQRSNWNVFGYSFFEWDNGSQIRINRLIKTLGINDISMVYLDNDSPLHNKSKDLPCWPYKGSVVLVGDTVIVKLSEPYNLK